MLIYVFFVYTVQSQTNAPQPYVNINYKEMVISCDERLLVQCSVVAFSCDRLN